MLYAEVILPLFLPPMSYEFDSELVGDVRLGSAVMVELGKNKLYEGIVCAISDKRPDYAKIKTIKSLTSAQPLVDESQLKLWRWIAEYYMCTLGEVMRCALPSDLKNSAFNETDFARGIFAERMVKRVRVIAEPDKALRSDKQREVFEQIKLNPLSLSSLYDTTQLRALTVKGLVEIVETKSSRSDFSDFVLPTLSEAQTNALESIRHHLTKTDVVLLHGVTGSGKTEIYISMIEQRLKNGEDVLYLLPEIALTTQLIKRLERVFEDRVCAYHSRINSRDRAELYLRVSRGGGQLILGARSSVFLPFKNLGLVIVDEEHDSSFKQMEMPPYYNARDVAVVLSAIHKSKVLMGSATPSMESYTNAKAGKYALVELKERYAGASLPRIVLSDNLRAVKRGERKGHFNKLLLDKIAKTLEAKNQVVLFQNRRGFSPFVECDSCGEVPGCPNCNVSLTLHKSEGSLKCHYCGYQIPQPKICPKCKKGELKPMGFGTEKIEEDLALLFPEARISRLDADTTSSKRAFEKIISDFENRQTDIIVGTQMITKGFDFSNVTLVGVLNADNVLNRADFRASERAFQLLTQVSGRAGRGECEGEVVIQTSQVESAILDCVQGNDYLSMIASESSLRQAFSYPPFCRLIALELRAKHKQTLYEATVFMNKAMREVFASRVLGPQTPAVDKIKDYYLMSFLLKIERNASVVRAKSILQQIITELNSREQFKYVKVICNVDPQ